MLIRTKFNGYSFDGTRSCFDPVSAAIAATTAAEAAAAAGTAAAGTAAAAAAAAPTIAAAAAPTLAGLGASAAPTLGAMTAAELGGGAAANAGLMSGQVAAAQAAGAGAGTGLTAAAAPTTAGIGMGTGMGEAATNPTLQTAIQNANSAANGPAQMSYAEGAQGISAAPPPPPPASPGITDYLAKGFKTGLEYVEAHPTTTGMGLMAAGQYMNQPEAPKEEKFEKVNMSNFKPSVPTQQPFQRSYEYQGYAVGGPVEQMAAQNAVGNNQMYPQAGLQTPTYSNPQVQRPMANNVVSPSGDIAVDPYTGEQKFADGGIALNDDDKPATKGQKAARRLSSVYDEMETQREKEAAALMNSRTDSGIIPRSRTQMLSSPYSAAIAELNARYKKQGVAAPKQAKTNLGDIDNYMDTPIDAANGGIMHGLGGYSDGGRLLRGPGDGVSDSIPAVIGKKQPARLADGEFVIPARIVSEIGNGSTEAGARQLYAMMERIQKTRKKSIGKNKVAVDSKASKHLPR